MKHACLSWFLLFIASFSMADEIEGSRINEVGSYQSVTSTLEKYLESSESGDIDTLKALHHEKASMVGLIHGELSIGTPQSYFDQIAKVGSPRAAGEPVGSAITYMQVDGDIANAEVQFVNFWCGTGTHYLQFIRVENDWKIIADLFWFRAMPDVDGKSQACVNNQ